MAITLKKLELEHGDKFGKLTVLRKIATNRGTKYRVGCVCGYSGMLVRASHLTSGRVTACLKCSSSAR